MKSIASVALAVIGSLPSATHGQPGCSVRVDSLAVRLENGQRVYVEPQSLTFGQRKVLILGGPVFFVDPPRRAEAAGRKAAGLLLDPTGKATLVPAPPGVEQMRHPRAVFQRGVGWHVVWVPELTDPDNRPDSATVMHGIFDGKRWTQPVVAARIAARMIIAEGLSTLIRTRDGLAIATPEAVPGQRRATVLVRDSLGWRRVSVPDVKYINYATLARTGEWLVVAYAGLDQDGSPATLVSRSRDNGRTWTTPFVVARGTTHQPTLLAVNNRLVLTWVFSPEGWQTERLQWAYSADAGGEWSASMDATEGATKVDYAAAVSSDGWPIIVAWLKDRYSMTTTARQRIGLVLKDSIAWMSDGMLSSPVIPILGATDKAGEMFLAWISIQGTTAAPKPELHTSSMRIRCPGIPRGEKQ